MYDGPWGNPQAYSDAHNFGLYMLDQYMKQNPAKTQYKIRQGQGKDPLDFTGEFEHYDGNRGGYRWNDIIICSDLERSRLVFIWEWTQR